MGSQRTPSAVPTHVWLACTLLALLRAVPALYLSLSPAPAGSVFLPIGFNPKDWLAYAAFVRQGDWLMVNPFLTDAQGDRFILLFHSLLGSVAKLTGLDVLLLLELSRIPLVFLFFYLLWRLLEIILPDPRVRGVACWLVAFSGGLEWLAGPLAALLPGPMAAESARALWHLNGWSTFTAFYNPLWIAGLALALPLLRILLGHGAHFMRDSLLLLVGLPTLYFIHPYSALFVATAYAVRLAMELVLGRGDGWRRLLAVVPATGLGLTVAFGINRWQLGDPAFEWSSAGAFGAQDLSVFWYPATLGILGVLAMLGWRHWLAEGHPWARALGAWSIAAILLHASPLLNGYHFVMYLHVPLCVLAAGPAANAIASWRSSRPASLRAVALIGLIAAVPIHATWMAVDEARAQSRAPVDYVRVAELLASAPAGNVLSPPDIGNLIPATSGHRVFTGHWFLTPDFEARNDYYWALVRDPRARALDLRGLLAQQRIRYLVLPTALAPNVEAVLRGKITGAKAVGSLRVLALTEPDAPAAQGRSLAE